MSESAYNLYAHNFRSTDVSAVVRTRFAFNKSIRKQEESFFTSRGELRRTKIIKTNFLKVQAIIKKKITPLSSSGQLV